jgi:beta-glucosidase/6-phospho-beta-glucosidase/beta-galactosidase
VFNSFFLGGFECATGYNRHREWIDQVTATRHDAQLDEDYRLLKSVGIAAAREGVRWPLIQTRFGYDFSTLDRLIHASRENGIELIYDLFHFGYPEGLDPFSDTFADYFADYCAAVARRVASQADGPCYFTPVNEPSFFSWAAGEVGLFAPHAKGRGSELKARLVGTAIRGVRAIRDVCPGARIVNVDPVCRVVAPEGRPDLAEAAENFNENVVFQSWDMLAGRTQPELGGSPEVLDIVGVNYYWTNQWALGMPEVPLAEDDPRYCELGDLVRKLADRYDRPLLIAETGHVGDKRSSWMETLTRQIELLLETGVPLVGVCLYPILGMPEWHDQTVWTRMGLWDLVKQNGHLRRVCHEPMLAALRRSQERLSKWTLVRTS